MSEKPEFRIAVEVVVKNNDRILVMKRGENESVAPGEWNVPAGKVELMELPEDGAIRECKEETGLDAVIIKEIIKRPRMIQKKGKDAYRLIYTYLMESTTPDPENSVVMNEEHSEYAWVTAEELKDPKYTLLADTKDILLKGAFGG